jgi:hypothetical protein
VVGWEGALWFMALRVQCAQHSLPTTFSNRVHFHNECLHNGPPCDDDRENMIVLTSEPLLPNRGVAHTTEAHVCVTTEWSHVCVPLKVRGKHPKGAANPPDIPSQYHGNSFMLATNHFNNLPSLSPKLIDYELNHCKRHVSIGIRLRGHYMCCSG